MINYRGANALEPMSVERVAFVGDAPRLRHANDAGAAWQRRQARLALGVDDTLAGRVKRDGRRREHSAFGCRRHENDGAIMNAHFVQFVENKQT